MTALDLFAILVLVVLVVAVVVIWVFLAMLPGKIAQKRGHPQAEAVNVCGILGGLTLGLLWPVAFTWAYLKPLGAGTADTENLESLREQVAGFEDRLARLERGGGEQL